jgi:tellurite resistance protein|tara:strand:- start:247 stop:1077 length:831 start_codon:yes stop_codon:yes gene_type:complete
MTNRHNKKRNTAFVFEALAREATVAIIKGDQERKEKVVSIVRKHFTGDSLLKRDLECYRSLYENQNLDETTSQRILEASKNAKIMIDPNGLFKQQTEIIKDINKELTPDTFNNFVPNYKSLATIAKMFNTSSPKESVILESRVLDGMRGEAINENLKPIDSLTFKTFTKKFNEKYSNSLLREQKELLNHFISSFSTDELELKIYLNREIGRLKKSLNEAQSVEEIANDQDMLNKTIAVGQKLEELSKETTLNETSLFTLLKTQELVKEIHSNGSND